MLAARPSAKVLPAYSQEVIQLMPLSQCTVTLGQQYCTHACPVHPEKLANMLHSPCARELYHYNMICHTTTYLTFFQENLIS